MGNHCLCDILMSLEVLAPSCKMVKEWTGYVREFYLFLCNIKWKINNIYTACNNQLKALVSCHHLVIVDHTIVHNIYLEP